AAHASPERVPKSRPGATVSRGRRLTLGTEVELGLEPRQHFRKSFVDREFAGLPQALLRDDPPDAPGTRSYLEPLDVFAASLFADALEQQGCQFPGCLLRLGHLALRGLSGAMVLGLWINN